MVKKVMLIGSRKTAFGSIPGIIVLSIVLFIGFVAACQTGGTPWPGTGTQENGGRAGLVDLSPPLHRPWLDITLPSEERARLLLAVMTLEEKVGQMTQPARDYLGHESNITKYGLGSVLSGGGSGPRENTARAWADMTDRYQKQALATRLGIPLMYGVDAVHGHNNLKGAVIFPHNIGLGASGNPGTVEEIARVTAIETAATGIRWTFAPCIAVPLDERWGRTYEGFSEDTDLVAMLGAAAVRGYQGPADHSRLDGNGFIMATAKHYLGDGGTTGGTDQGDVRMSGEELRTLFLPPYESAIQAGVGSVMVSFSSWNGIKMHQQAYLINEVLKGELGFDGFVVSDWAGVKQLPGSPADQIALAVNAGIDMVMVPDSWREFIRDLLVLVSTGIVSQERVDEAVYRILLAKFRLGLFEAPLANPELLPLVGSQEHRDLARRAVSESVVVLKNSGLLPLNPAGLRIGLVGQAADDIGYQCGGWTISWQGSIGPITDGTTILQGLQQAVPDTSLVTHARRAAELGPVDIAIVVASEPPYAEGKGDNRHLGFPATAAADIRELADRGIPVLTILISGRPLVIHEALRQSTAFLAAWLPGTEGSGISDIILGKAKPTGRLPYTWFDNVEAIPLNSREPGSGVLFPFGYGLSW
jgi:beta-glucosidase